MQIKIHTKSVNLTPRLEDYITKKVERLERYMPNIANVRVDLRQEKHKGKEVPAVQLTLRNERGMIIRAEERRETEVFAAVDLAVDKMYKQISRYKGKSKKRKNSKRVESEAIWDTVEMIPVSTEDVEDYDAVEPEVLRRKDIMLVPMSEAEAIDQMELLGHDFFVFYSGKEDAINVLYRRKDGNYGVLTPRLD